MSYTIEGRIHHIGETVQVSDRFSKREFVIETKGEYPQTVALEFVKDKCTILDQFKVGQNVTCDFNLRGREWEDPKTCKPRWFNTLNAWKMTAVGGQKPARESNKEYPEEPTGDLPF